LGRGRGGDRQGWQGPSLSLGAQQGKIRLLQECLGICSVGGVHADSHARRHVKVPTLDAVWRGDRCQQVVCAEGRILGTSHFRQQNHEFIATVTAHRVRTAHTPCQSTRDGRQELVAGRMAQSVVDALEAVQVDEQHRQRTAMATCRCDRPVEPVGQQQPVRQASEDIVLRQMGHSERQRARCAHVVKHDHCANHPPVSVMNGGGGVLDCGLTPVATDEQAVVAQAGVGVVPHRQCERIPNRFAAVRVDDPHHVLQRPADRLCRRPAGHALGDRIQIRDLACQVGAENGVPDRIERDLRTLPVHAQCPGIGADTLGA